MMHTTYQYSQYYVTRRSLAQLQHTSSEFSDLLKTSNSTTIADNGALLGSVAKVKPGLQ